MTKQATCIQCGKINNQVPLVAFSYQGDEFWICPEHLPILIHSPNKLIGKLADAEKLTPADTD